MCNASLMKEKPKDAIHPESRQQLRTWLSQHYGREAGLWLVFNKKSSGKAVMSYSDIVEELLCFGWIDSKPNALDEDHSLLWIAPRKETANWSKLNKERAQLLIAAGQMTEVGLQKIERAKLNGTWTALDTVEALELPPDLQSALAAFPQAQENFSAFPRSVKRNILEWIQAAKKPETRSKRVQETAQLAALNQRANQWRDAGKPKPQT